jgi:hypothetical protein
MMLGNLIIGKFDMVCYCFGELFSTFVIGAQMTVIRELRATIDKLLKLNSIK